MKDLFEAFTEKQVIFLCSSVKILRCAQYDKLGVLITNVMVFNKVLFKTTTPDLASLRSSPPLEGWEFIKKLNPNYPHYKYHEIEKRSEDIITGKIMR